jgi:peroxiredoxin
MNNETVYLLKVEANDEVVVDSTIMTDGSFSFDNSVSSPGLYRVIPGKHKYPIRYFFMDKGVTVYNSLINEKGMLKVPEVHGNSLQDAYNSYSNDLEGFQDSIRKINMIIYDAERNNKKVDTSYLAKIANYESETTECVKEHIYLNGGNLVSAWITWFNYRSSYDLREIEMFYNLIDPLLKNSPPAIAIESRLAKLKKLQPGIKAPDFILSDTLGHQLALNDFRGKYLLIDFWASWCKPCREQLPEVKALYSEFGPKGLNIIGISLDADRGRWVEALNTERMNWPQVSDLKKWDQQVVSDYNVSAIPFMVLVDPQGAIVAYGKSLAEVKSILSKVL